jgi:cellulose synthase/poly-beta-1,6-N-acetylglucosamine synthase-like glycosyltransferase
MSCAPLGKLFWGSVAFVAYAYAGYPAILWLAARRATPSGTTPYTPSVTLIIAAYDEGDVIHAKLENALALDYPAHLLDIVVAADGSHDDTVLIASRFADQGVRVSYHPDRRGKLAALQRAVETSSSEIVVFSDANNTFETGTLRHLVAPFVRADVGVASGAKRVLRGDGELGDAEGLYWKYESFIKEQESRLGTTVAVVGELLAIRRSLWERPPPGLVIDDFYVAMRALARNHRVAYVPEARSFERVSASAAAEVERRTRNVAGRLQILALGRRALPLRRPVVMWMLISHKVMRPLVPLAMVLALGSNIAAAMRSRGPTSGTALSRTTARVLLVPHLGFYGAAAVGASAPEGSTAARRLYLATFLVASNAASLLAMLRFVRGKQRADWKRVQRRPGVVATDATTRSNRGSG